jgi:hypothetical protein
MPQTPFLISATQEFLGVANDGRFVHGTAMSSGTPSAFREETARRLALSGPGALMTSLPSMLSLRSIYTTRALPFLDSGTLSVTLDEFKPLIDEHTTLNRAEITSSEGFSEGKPSGHRFLVFEMHRHQKRTLWLRIDLFGLQGASKPFSGRRASSSRSVGSSTTVTVSSTYFSMHD